MEYGHLVYWNAAVHTADEDKQSAGVICKWEAFSELGIRTDN